MSSNNPEIQNLNLINSEVFINEFKIIKETNSIIKNNISKHFKNCLYIDDLFYILDFQLLFINQISKTIRNNQGNEEYKNKIVNDLVQINKEMSQIMITSFLSKLNNKFLNFKIYSNSVPKKQEKSLNRNKNSSLKTFHLKLETPKKKNFIENLKKKINTSEFIENNNHTITKKKINSKIKVKKINNSVEKKSKFKINNNSLNEEKKNFYPNLTTRREIKSYMKKDNVASKKKNSIIINMSTDNLYKRKFNRSQLLEIFQTNLSETNSFFEGIKLKTDFRYNTNSIKKNNNLSGNFEERLIKKNQDILNKYNNQKSEEQKMKEAEKAYYESINREKTYQKFYLKKIH
jgi:hypothetical protein